MAIRSLLLNCPACGKFVSRVAWKGWEQTRCRNRHCGKRLLVVSDGDEIRVTMVDTAPKRVKIAAIA